MTTEMDELVKEPELFDGQYITKTQQLSYKL